MSEAQKLALGRMVIYRVGTNDPPMLARTAFLPAMVVSFTSDTSANLRIFTDGPEAPAHKTNVSMGDEPGQWRWPTRV